MSAIWRSRWMVSPTLGRRTRPSLWAAIVLSCLCLGMMPQSLWAMNPPPVQVYYVPVPEDQGLTALQGIFPGNNACSTFGQPEVVAPIITYNSISVLAAGTIIYYDHWEDGYEIDLSNPTQASTEIWGDGNPANGAPPGIPGDVLAANDVIVLNESVNPATRQSVLDYDGGDRFGATRTTAFTRAMWASGSRTLLAGAIEVYPVDDWGTAFRSPVGVDTPSPDLFTYAALVVMAGEDDTLVEMDLDANGTFESQVVLQQGQSHLTAATVLEGAAIRSSAPVQVALITGDLCDNYESRWYVLFPEEQWSDRYYSPVSTVDSDLTVAYLYNPHDTALTVTRATMGGGTLDTVVAAQSSAAVPVPSTSGARFASSDGRSFIAIAAIDAAGAFNSSADWGFSLVPEQQLTTQTLIGWGGGRDPESAVNPNENSSPVWVIPVFGEGNGPTVNICVDYKGDNIGPLQDVNGFNYDLLLTLQEFESAKVFDPSGDQTGMLLYVCPEVVDAPVTARLAAAWGQDPAVASPGQPALDLGTTAPPAATFEAGKAATLEIDHDGDGQADGGDRVRYTVIIRNASRVPIPGVTISDTIPLYTSYVTQTTTVDLGSGPVTEPDAGETPFPLDEGGISLGTLPTGGVFTVTFAVDIDNPLPEGLDRIRNVAVVRAGNEEERPFVETPLDYDPALAIRKLTNGEDANDAPGVVVQVGSTVTWTYVVTNTGPVSITALTVTDDQPGVVPVYLSGDDDLIGVMEVGEVWVYQATGIAVAGQYSNTGTAVGVDVSGDVVTVTDVSHYFGGIAAIDLTKVASREAVPVGGTVVYTVTAINAGSDPLRDVVVTDNRCTLVYVDGDDEPTDVLDVGEAWVYTCSVVLTQTTVNVATVTAVDSFGEPLTATASARVIVPLYFLPLIASPAQEAPCPPPDGCPLDGEIKALAVHSAKGLVYAATRNPDRLVAIDQFSMEIVAERDTGSQPWGVAVNEATQRVYVSTFGDGSVRVYHADTLALEATIAVGEQPMLMAIFPALDTVMVLLRKDSRVAVIQGTTVVQNFPSGGSGPIGIATDAANQRVFISHRDSASMSMLRRVNGEWQSFPGPIFADGRQLFGLAYASSSNRLFTLYADSQGQWLMDVWEPHNDMPWGRFSTQAMLSGGAVASPDVGGLGIAYNPATGRLFVANTGANSLSVVSGASLGVITTIPLGQDPFAVAVDSANSRVFVGLRAARSLIKLADVE